MLRLQTYTEKFLIIKKKHYIGIYLDDSKDPVIKGMEGIKGDRPAWINKIEVQFAQDIKFGKDPTLNIKKEYRAMESGQIPLDELAVRLVLQKDPNYYEAKLLQRVVGNELGAKQGDVIKYYKSDIVAGGGTSNYNLLSRKKYLEMLRTTMEDSLKVMGYDYLRDVVGLESLDKCNGDAKR